MRLTAMNPRAAAMLHHAAADGRAQHTYTDASQAAEAFLWMTTLSYADDLQTLLVTKEPGQYTLTTQHRDYSGQDARTF